MCRPTGRTKTNVPRDDRLECAKDAETLWVETRDGCKKVWGKQDQRRMASAGADDIKAPRQGRHHATAHHKVTRRADGGAHHEYLTQDAGGILVVDVWPTASRRERTDTQQTSARGAAAITARREGSTTCAVGPSVVSQKDKRRIMASGEPQKRSSQGQVLGRDRVHRGGSPRENSPLHLTVPECRNHGRVPRPQSGCMPRAQKKNRFAENRGHLH
jgi:hypothetical protein